MASLVSTTKSLFGFLLRSKYLVPANKSTGPWLRACDRFECRLGGPLFPSNLYSWLRLAAGLSCLVQIGGYLCSVGLLVAIIAVEQLAYCMSNGKGGK